MTVKGKDAMGKEKVEEKKPGSLAKEAKTDTGTVLIAAGILAVILAAIVFLTFAAEPEEPGFEEILSGMQSNEGSFSQASLVGEINALVSMDGGGLAADVKLNTEIEAAYDSKEKKIHVKSESAMTMPFGEVVGQVSDTYIIGNVLYTTIEDNELGGTVWVKQEIDYNIWKEYDSASPMEILGFLEAEVIGSETVHGKDAWKISVKPDMNAIINHMLESDESFSSLGLTESDMQDAIAELDDKIREFDGTLWVSKEDYAPLKFEFDLTLSIDSSVFESAGSGTVDVDLSGSFDIYTDSQDAITLPDEAKEAIDIYELYFYCGDGICDQSEDNLGCPEDCGEGLSCVDLCGDGNCAEVVCMAEGCPCAETAESCPEDCNSTEKVI